MDRTLTPHAGSLPRRDDVAEMIWARIDAQPVARDAVLASAFEIAAVRVHVAGPELPIAGARRGADTSSLLAACGASRC